MIHYSSKRLISAAEFIDVLKRSTLSERRPINDLKRIQAMLDNANVLITAWDGDMLVGISRAITDKAFCTYLSDLAVDVAYQKSGIGKQLVELTHEIAGHNTTLILLAAPAAVSYYPKIGMEQFTNCFFIRTKV
jgi:ribosomal protein S18 acetylase RimI-like enzyme